MTQETTMRQDVTADVTADAITETDCPAPPLPPGVRAQVERDECHRLLAELARSARPIPAGFGFRAASLLADHGVPGFDHPLMEAPG